MASLMRDGMLEEIGGKHARLDNYNAQERIETPSWLVSKEYANDA